MPARINPTYKKVFQDENKLAEMFKLRNKGWSTIALGQRYGVNHTSIVYQIKKHGTKIRQKFKVKKRIRYISKIPLSSVGSGLKINEEDRKRGATEINQGKNYHEYLREKDIRLVEIGGWKIIKTEDKK